MEKLHTYNINWELVAQGLGLPIDKTLDLFDDGRIMGRVGEFLHQNSELGVRENENSSFDVFDVNNIGTLFILLIKLYFILKNKCKLK